MGLENPAERKHQKLTRSVARGVVDHDLKPNGAEKRSLAMVGWCRLTQG